MPLYFITGSAGTGKSAVCRALKDKGYEAYDTDTDGLAKWQNIETGYIHPKSSVKKKDRTPDFLKVHDWNVSRNDIEQLHAKAINQLVFLCGIIDNQEELSDLFSGLFVLHVDEETLKKRLAARTDNDWGKQAHELAQTLKTHAETLEKYRSSGATIIDAAKPIEQVVNDIVLSVTTSSNPNPQH